MLLYNFLIQSPVIPVSAISHSRNHNLGKMNKTETPSDTFSELHSTIAIGLLPALVGLLLGIYSLWYFVVPALKYQNTSNQPPIVGYRSLWEPTWLVRLRFIRGSRKIIGEGYERVSYHNWIYSQLMPTDTHLVQRFYVQGATSWNRCSARL